jgi:anti-anti-sigma factor
MELRIVEETGRLTHVALIGRLDTEGVHAVDVAFHARTAARRRDAIVDVSELTYIASLGVGMIIGCARSLSHNGRRMVLAGARGDVERVLRSVALEKLLPVVATVDDARQRLAAPQPV